MRHQITKTDAIIIYDRALAKGDELSSVAKYLAKATDAVRADYLRRYPRIEAQLLAILGYQL